MKLFCISDMSFAAYLLTTRKLRFLRIDPVAPRAQIVFEDPDGIGPTFEVDFTNGAEAPAAEFHAKLRYLRKRIDEAVRKAVADAKASHASNRGVSNGQ